MDTNNSKIKNKNNVREAIFVTIFCFIFTGFYMFMVVKACMELADAQEALTNPGSTVTTTTMTEPTTSVITATSTTTTTTSTEPTTITSKVESTPSTEATIAPASGSGYFNVPLDEDLQDHIFELCESYNVEPAMVVAMIERESGYRASVLGDSGRSYGLMQIQPRWNKDRMNKLGCTDLLDPYQNVAVGIDLIAELQETGNSTAWVLMAYNGGQAYANNKISQGVVSTYAETVMSNTNLLNGARGR